MKFIPNPSLPAHVFDEGDVTQCPDCGALTEIDEGRRVHNDGSDECPQPVAWVFYDANRITELVCSRCIMSQERKTMNATPDGVIAIYEPGTVKCKRCGEVS